MELMSVGTLTEGCGYSWVLQAGVTVSWRQVGSGEVATLLIVVLDVEAGEFGEADPQSAAAIVDVLSIQRLKHSGPELTTLCSGGLNVKHVCAPAWGDTHQFGSLSRRSIKVLQQSLELAVLGEDDDPQHRAKFREDLRSSES